MKAAPWWNGGVSFERRFHFGACDVRQFFDCNEKGRISGGMDDLTLDRYLDAYPAVRTGVVLEAGRFYDVPPPPGITRPFRLWGKVAQVNFLLCLTKTI